MSELISGKEALIALANGEDVECRAYEKNWVDAGNHNHNIGLFFDGGFQFRLKPRTITINGIEVPAPFEPKDGDDFHVYYLHGLHECGFAWMHSGYYKKPHLVWKSKEEIKQVVAALRSIFK